MRTSVSALSVSSIGSKYPLRTNSGMASSRQISAAGPPAETELVNWAPPVRRPGSTLRNVPNRASSIHCKAAPPCEI